MLSRSISFRAHQDDALPLRTEQFQGKEYLVVPVIALVEGVLQGMNADVPELALAEEFGRAPESWNGRPLVMNHPTINNVPVSANSPAILEEYAFGQLFNTVLDGTKLKTEAWIDLARVEELGGEVADTVERLRAGKDVEVSTGLFAGAEKVSGYYNNKAYYAIWRGVIPDHLAFLSEGTLGACSIADGCGAPRVNAQRPTTWQEYSMTTKLNTSKNAPKAQEKTCTCNTGTDAGADSDSDAIKASKAQEFQAASEASGQFDIVRLMAHAVPGTLIDKDIRTLLQTALHAVIGPHKYFWLIGFTTEKAIYETYDCNDCYATFQRSYSIGTDRTVTLSDDVEQVNLLTEIAPVKLAEVSPTLAISESSTAPKTPHDNKETTPMADNTTPKTAAEVVANSTTEPAAPAPTQETASPTEVRSNAEVAPAPAAPKMRTMSEYLAEMPEEMREVFQSGLRLHAEKKTALIEGLKASGRCKFSEDQLKAMGIEMLENLAELAAVPTYDGVASPRANAVDDNAVPAAPVAFPVAAAS